MSCAYVYSSNVLRDPGFESATTIRQVIGNGTGNPPDVDTWGAISSDDGSGWFQINFESSEEWVVSASNPDTGSNHARYDSAAHTEALAAFGCRSNSGIPYSARVQPGDVANFSFRGRRAIDDVSLFMRMTCHDVNGNYLVDEFQTVVINSTYTSSGTLSMTVPASGEFVTIMMFPSAGNGITDVDNVVLELVGTAPTTPTLQITDTGFRFPYNRWI